MNQQNPTVVMTDPVAVLQLPGAPEAGGQEGRPPPLPFGWGVQGGQKCPFGTRGAEVPFGRKGLESVS
jgi:hypothetical protein